MRTRACLSALLLAAAGFAVAAPPALAQEKDAVTEMARRRFQEGVKFFDQKKYEEARAAFLQAYALKHHPAVLLNLAQSEIRSGHPLEASRHFTAYLRESPASGAERGEAEKGLAAARTKLGRIHVAVPTGAEVMVDGESVGQAPFSEPIDVLPGTHTVEGKLGTRTASSQVSVQVGKSASVTLNLEGGTAATPVPVPPTTGPTPPTATPPAETPEKPPAEGPKEATPPAGETVQVSTEGREPFFVWLGHNGVGIAGVAATLIGAGVGTGFAIAANKASDNADTVASQIQAEAQRIDVVSTSMCVDPHKKVYEESIYADKPGNMTAEQTRLEEVARIENACNMLTNNIDVRKKDRTYATAGFVLAGVGLTTTLAAYFLTSGRSSSTTSKGASVRFVTLPIVGPSQTGLAVIGTF
jgi:hypothetical protein